MSKLKNREEFEGGLEKRKGKGEKRRRKKKKRVIKHTFIKLLNDRKKKQKQGRILEGRGEEFFWLARIYTPDFILDFSQNNIPA